MPRILLSKNLKNSHQPSYPHATDSCQSSISLFSLNLNFRKLLVGQSSMCTSGSVLKNAFNTKSLPRVDQPGGRTEKKLDLVTALSVRKVPRCFEI